MEITLTQGKIALIDDEDYELVKDRRWFPCCPNGVAFYAIDKDGKGMHRLILGAKKGQLVDHINGDGLDNRRQNLRISNHRQNKQNTIKRTNKSSKYKGVYWLPKRQKWRARIIVDGKQIPLGNHTTEVEAAKVYNNAAKKYFGEFANINEIDDE